MSAGLKRAGTAALIAATIFVYGCDNAQNQADKQVRADLAEARHLALTEDTPDAARAKLVSASENPDASNSARAEAYAARAQAELETALALMRKIAQTELELSRIGWGIIELSQQIRSSGSAVAGYRKFDPKPVKDAIEAKLAEARGGANQSNWFTHDRAPVPTLTAVTQEIARLEGELAQKNNELNTLNERRVRLLEQAEQAASEANSRQGQASLEPFKRASDLRKQSGDVAVQIDQARSQIARLERNLAVAKGQQAVVNEVITQLQEQITQLDQAWRNYETQAAAHQQLSARILGTPGSGDVSPGAVGGTISQKAAEVDRLVKELQQLRSDAIAAANSASDFFAKAYDAAAQAVNEYRSRPDPAIGSAMEKVLNPLQHRLQQAAVQRVLAELYASEAAGISKRIDVRDMVQTAIAGTGLSMPAPLAGADLNANRQSALSNASLAYKTSDDLLGGLIDGSASPDLKNMALVSRALNYYGWAQLARQVKDERQAGEFVNNAKAARDLAFENNAPLPPMPAELGPPPKRAEPAPETPSDEATTDPSAPATSPDEAAIRAAIEKFHQAIKSGDAAAAKLVAEIEPGAEAFFDLTFSTAGSFLKFEKAVKAKFGSEPAPEGQMNFSASNPLEEMLKAKITINGDEAVLASEGPQQQGEQNKLVKKDGEWKLLFPAPKTDSDRQAMEMMKKLGTSIDEIAVGIESGKYATQQSVGEAFMQALFSGMAPEGLGGAPSPGPQGTPPPQ